MQSYPAGRAAVAALIALGLAGIATAQPAPDQGGPPPGMASPPPGGFPGKPPSPEELQKKLREIMLEKAPPPKVALPPPPADRRVIEGTWIGNELPSLRYTKDADGRPIAMTAQGQATFDARIKATYVDRAPAANAATQCLPPGAIWQLGVLYPFQIYQTRDAFVLLGSEYHTTWTARMATAHRTAGPREYMGDGVANWDGDTLVIETTGFKLPLWIDADGHPASADARLTYRLRRIGEDGKVLEIRTTIDDPVNYTRPWTIAHTYQWRPDMEFFSEYDCETQTAGTAGGPPASGTPASPNPGAGAK